MDRERDTPLTCCNLSWSSGFSCGWLPCNTGEKGLAVLGLLAKKKRAGKSEFRLNCSVTLEKQGNRFWGRPFLVGQPPNQGKVIGATEQLSRNWHPILKPWSLGAHAAKRPTPPPPVLPLPPLPLTPVPSPSPPPPKARGWIAGGRRR